MQYGPQAPGPTAFENEELPTREAFLLRGHEGAVHSVRFTCDGGYCLTGGQDRTLRLWNPAKGLAIKTYLGHGQEVRDAAAERSNAKMLSVGGDKLAFLWDVATGRVIRKLRGHAAAINAVAFCDDGAVAVTGSYDRSVKCWDMRSQSLDPLQSMSPFRDSVTAVAVRGHVILAASVDGTVRSFDARFGRATTDDLGAPVAAMALTNDGLCILASCVGSTLRLMDRERGGLLAEYSGHATRAVRLECCLSPTDSHVVSGSEDGRVCFWELVEAGLVCEVDAHPGHAVSCVAYHPSAATPMLLTAATDGLIKVWRS